MFNKLSLRSQALKRTSCICKSTTFAQRVHEERDKGNKGRGNLTWILDGSAARLNGKGNTAVRKLRSPSDPKIGAAWELNNRPMEQVGKRLGVSVPEAHSRAKWLTRNHGVICRLHHGDFVVLQSLSARQRRGRVVFCAVTGILCLIPSDPKRLPAACASEVTLLLVLPLLLNSHEYAYSSGLTVNVLGRAVTVQSCRTASYRRTRESLESVARCHHVPPSRVCDISRSQVTRCHI